jgi:hypothetical protein
LFFQGDVRLQAFFAEVTRGVKLPYESLLEMQKQFKNIAIIGDITNKCIKFYNLLMRNDMGVLTRLGLMYRRVAIVNIKSSYYARIERRISWHGRNYVQNNLLDELPHYITGSIKKDITKLLDSQKKVITECLRIESEGTPGERRNIAEKKKDYLVCLGS